MSTVNMAQKIKLIHPQYLICYRVGNFYNCYGKDTTIISWLFNYKIKEVDKNIFSSGFPKNAISRVTARLEREKINHIIIDTRNNYDIDKKQDYGNLNRYDEVFEKSYKIINIRKRIYKITEILEKEANLEKIRKIEEIIYEGRKV